MSKGWKNSLEIYLVEKVYEGDYGCEEPGAAGPMVSLILQPLQADNAEKLSVEVPEITLSAQGISEGKKVCFNENGEILKYVRVVAAVIYEIKDGERRIFATARGYGEYKGWWEFPGGKIEQGETPEQAIVREIKEELTAEIVVEDFIKTLEYDYPTFHLSMDCFWARIVSGRIELKEAEAARWLRKDEMENVAWLPADLELVEDLKNKSS